MIRKRIYSLVTVHKPSEHYAIINGLTTKTYQTEAEMVRDGLKEINLKEYDGKSRSGGNERLNMITWTERV